MTLYYAGFNATPLFCNDDDQLIIVQNFTEVPCPGITDIEIGWTYFLFWRGSELYLYTRNNHDSNKQMKGSTLIQVPEALSGRCKKVVPGKECLSILCESNNIWQYQFFENTWKKVPKVLHKNEDTENEIIIDIKQAGGIFALTNLGRVFNIPLLLEMQKRVQFIDIACGFDHTILLAKNGDVYSMGMGTRGQLGHGDLEDCDEPKLINALAGLKIVHISASGWHTAVITHQGDLYTWGWNTAGELGIGDDSDKVIATPTLIDFHNEDGKNVEMNVKKVQCGNTFTICMLDDGSLWGCGSNKYGQLGQTLQKLTSSRNFVKLNVDLGGKFIRDFKCHEWGTVIFTD